MDGTTGTNVEATVEAGEPRQLPGAPASGTVWWTFTAPASGNTGLQADYFDGTNFQTLARSVPTGQVPNEPWGSSGPAGTGVDNFSVRWIGQIEPL